MKTAFYSFLLICAPLFLWAQGGVVSAPVLEAIEGANKATLIKQLTEAVKQTTVLTDTYKQLKKSVELYYEVSDVLKSADMVQDVLNRQIDLVNTAAGALRDISKVKGASTQSLQRVRGNINRIMDTYKSNMQLITTVLTGEAFKMTDGERLQLLISIQDKTDKAIKEVSRYQSAFEGGATMKNLVKTHL